MWFRLIRVAHPPGHWIGSRDGRVTHAGTIRIFSRIDRLREAKILLLMERQKGASEATGGLGFCYMERLSTQTKPGSNSQNRETAKPREGEKTLTHFWRSQWLLPINCLLAKLFGFGFALQWESRILWSLQFMWFKKGLITIIKLGGNKQQAGFVPRV